MSVELRLIAELVLASIISTAMNTNYVRLFLASSVQFIPGGGGRGEYSRVLAIWVCPAVKGTVFQVI